MNNNNSLSMPEVYDKAIELIEKLAIKSSKNINMRFNVGRKYWVVGIGSKRQAQGKTLLEAIDLLLEKTYSSQALQGKKEDANG